MLRVGRCSRSRTLMTFAGRYKLGDLLLTTTVETFPAVNLSNQARVLVHVFPAAEHRLSAADPPQAVRDRFIELTGASPALIRSAGVDPDTAYAYVVTDELPKETISGWARSSARSASQSAAPLGLSGLFTAMPEAGPASQAQTSGPASQAAPAASGRPAATPFYVPAEDAPGPFTKEFSSLFGAGKPQKPAQPEGTPPERDIAAATSIGGPGIFANTSGIPAVSVSHESQKPSSAPATSSGGPGAFTKIFRVSPESASPDARRTTDAAPPARMSSGHEAAFTGMFGSELSAEPARPADDEGAFTKIFGKGVPASNPPVSSSEPSARPFEPLPSSAQNSRESGMAPPLSSSGEPLRRTTPGSSTNFFGRSAFPSPPAGPALGPSEYTKVISFRAIPQPPPEPTPGPTATPSFPAPPVMPSAAPPYPVAPMGGQAPPASYPNVPLPSVPPGPLANPASMPQPVFPGTPGMPAPQFPPVLTPPVPWPPSGGGAHVPAVPAPQVTSRRPWLLLILILNGLFVLAVLVILLFALKGH